MRKTTITIEEIGDDHGHHHGRSDRVEHLLEILIGKVGELVTNVEGLEAAIAAMENAEVAGVEELKTLADEIAQLQAGSISQETIDSLAGRATAAAEALTAATKAAEGEPPAEPPAEGEPPVEPPAEGTPPEGEAPAPGEGEAPPVV